MEEEETDRRVSAAARLAPTGWACNVEGVTARETDGYLRFLRAA